MGQSGSHFNAKYGSDPGVTFYTHISDQYTPFHTRVINAPARDATYVLDGLLNHESDLRIEEHYTDTAGFTDHVFGLMHLLGFRFAPRIRNLKDKNLYVDGDAKAYPTLTGLVGGPIQVKHIRTYWDEILRLAASIKQGTVSASLMLRKLGSYPRQNGLAVALRELGRMERTLFTLDWLQSTDLRRRVQIGLNKGEAKNALARAVFFNRLGELRDRSFENQRYRASGLNLVVAAVVLWNTVYLERAVQSLKAHGQIDDRFVDVGRKAAVHAEDLPQAEGVLLLITGIANDPHDLAHLMDALCLRQIRVGAVVGRVAEFEVENAFENEGAAHEFGDEVGEGIEALDTLHQRMQFEEFGQTGARVGDKRLEQFVVRIFLGERMSLSFQKAPEDTRHHRASQVPMQFRM